MKMRETFILFLCLTWSTIVLGQDGREFSIAEVFNKLDIQQESIPQIDFAWWNPHVLQSTRDGVNPVTVDINNLLALALRNSAQINVYSEVPLIRETAVREADSAFDWSRFAETLWNDSNVPVGSTLTVGGAGNRYLDDHLTAQAGFKRKLKNGAQFQAAQQFGYQNTNSNFFIPKNQGTSRMTLDFTIPLMRGRGTQYNTSLQMLTRTDVETANEEFVRQLQSHLLEIARGYWALYLERGSLAQKVRLYLKTKLVYDELESRRTLDAQPTQLVSAYAALQNRQSDLIRAQAATKNAETRLRALINAAELGSAELTELIPAEVPAAYAFEVQSLEQMETAVLHRPEIKAAMLQIKAGATRLQMAKHELMPQLNLITQAYLSGLRGNSDVGGSWVDQFTTGAPSYSVGLQYEVPIGNRAANARRDRRTIELRQLQEQYRSALETVKAEVEVAVRELETSFREVQAKAVSLAAANSEAATIEARWRRMIDGDGTSSLNLESLLRAQERVAESEYSYLQSLLTYNLSFLNLKRANGTLLEWENTEIGYFDDNGVKRTFPDKLGPSPRLGPEGIIPEEVQNVPIYNENPSNGVIIDGT